MNKERILDLADIIENDRLPLVEFNMMNWALQRSDIHPECGTAACIAGYAVCAAHGNKWAKERAERKCGAFIPRVAQRILGLGNVQATNLFHGSTTRDRSLAARVLRHLAKTGKVDWSIP